MKEIWKDIEGYEGMYQVSNLGRVRSLKYRDKKNIHILKGGTDKRGYKLIGLYFKERKTYKVHRLVAEAFIPNPNNLPQVNHIDGNPSNNIITNLEWCDSTYNAIHAYKTGLHKSNKVGKRPVYCKEENKYFKSCSEAGRYFQCGPSTIRQVCDGIAKQLYKKYTIKYA